MQRKRKLLKISAGLAKDIASKLAGRGPAFQAFQGTGRALEKKKGSLGIRKDLLKAQAPKTPALVAA